MGVGAVIRMICRHWKGRIVLWTAPHLRIGPSDAIVFKNVWGNIVSNLSFCNGEAH